MKCFYASKEESGAGVHLTLNRFVLLYRVMSAQPGFSAGPAFDSV
jgi:hypothetical protein